MKTAFVIRNHHGYYLTKQQEWAGSRELGALYVAQHKDLAINSLVEVNARDIELRCEVMEVSLDEKGRPQLPKDQQDIDLEDSAQKQPDEEAQADQEIHADGAELAADELPT